MNQETNQAFKPLNATAVKLLCTQTKETKLTETQLKNFSVVDLWSIQKSRKVTALRSNMAF
jgi:hypothetical protein